MATTEVADPTSGAPEPDGQDEQDEQVRSQSPCESTQDALTQPAQGGPQDDTNGMVLQPAVEETLRNQPVATTRIKTPPNTKRRKRRRSKEVETLQLECMAIAEATDRRTARDKERKEKEFKKQEQERKEQEQDRQGKPSRAPSPSSSSSSSSSPPPLPPLHPILPLALPLPSARSLNPP